MPFTIYAGTTINVRLWNLPAPATCTMSFRFPDGTTVDLGARTATYAGPSSGSPAAYAVTWTLAIPAAQVGDGMFTYGCAYLGIQRFDSSFGVGIQAS